jgi:glycosyltransferase involved in cell wall biosynthesis
VSLPLVSVLVPTYNGERFLRQALRSALTQTHRNLEVLVGDDCSTDGTPEILAEIAAADPRVRVVRHPSNLGPHENSKALLREVRGDFVKFLLHDDLLAPACIQVLLKGMRSPSVSLAFSHRGLVDEEGRPVTEYEFPRAAQVAGELDGRRLGNACLEQLSNLMGEATTVLFRRADVDIDKLLLIDGTRVFALDDLGLWLRLLEKGNAFYDPRTLSFFRWHGGQRSSLARVRSGAASDWPRLFDWACRHGFLADPAQERRAFTNALLNAATTYTQQLASDQHSLALEGVFIATARLLEMARGPIDRTLPLQDRAHRADVLDLFGQPLDVWGRTFEYAVAAPPLDAAHVSGVVDAFRRVRDAGVTSRFLLAVDEAQVESMIELAEAALTGGSDIDVELVPTAQPLELVTEARLAVAARGHTWHEGRAGGLWSFDPPCAPAVDGSSVRS